MLPSVSVVVPLYNHERFIAAALYSVFNQSHPAREIIVVDDGSSDTSFGVLQSLAQGRPEMVIWRSRNRGAHNAINAGVQRATSELVAILNSDDEYEPDRLRSVAAAFQADGKLDALATGLRCIDNDGAPVANAWYEGALAYYRQEGRLGRSLINGNFVVTTSNLVARRGLFDVIGGFSNFRYAHDLDFFLRLVSSERRFRILDDVMLRYRTHASNTISEGHDKVKVEWAVVTALFAHDMARRSGVATISELLDVLRQHGLDRVVLFLLAYFAHRPPRGIGADELFADPEAMKIVREMLA